MIRPQRRAVVNAVWLLVPLFAVWAFAAATSAVGMQTRLAIAVFPLMAALGALAVHALETMPRKPLAAAFVLKALIGVTLVFSAAELLHAAIALRPLTVLSGTVPAETYRREQLGPLGEVLAQFDALPDGTRIRFLFEPRGGACESRFICLGDTLFDFWSGARRAGESPDTVLTGWAAEGDDYLLVFNEGRRLWLDNGLSYWPDLDAELPAALDPLGVPVWTSDGGLYTLYRLPEGE